MTYLPRTLTAFAALLAAALLLTALPARADMKSDAERYVEEKASEGTQILKSPAPDGGVDLPSFRNFVLETTAGRTIALFALGAYKRGADPAELDAYVNAVTDYAVASYEAHVGNYKGQTLEITSATVRSEDDAVVSARILNADGSPVADAMVRVIRTDEGLRIFDVQVEGIWLAVEQRNQFSAFLGQNNGSIPALTKHLEGLARSLRANAEQPQT